MGVKTLLFDELPMVVLRKERQHVESTPQGFFP